ncbi:MAG: phosphatidate cytidylyltransferase [Bifidobacteriaceae bacterium]|jgi:phosphatidate cytidylyltransferase|nr:phosphatidate cytidylyltransferase [Bifidobacteriaceae bacterium]
MPEPVPAAKRKGRDLRVAVPTALGLIALLVTSLWFSPWPFVAMVSFALVIGMRELSQALEVARFRIPFLPLAVGSVATQVAAAYSGPSGALVGVFLTLAAATLWRGLEGDYKPGLAVPGQRSLTQDVYATAFAVLYLPTLVSLVVLLAFLEQGRFLVLLLVAVPVASDTGGFFAGLYLGKHPLAPHVSPKKTWEGLGGSVVLASATGVVGIALMGHPWYFGLALGIFGALAATLGDLGESLLKRSIGIKDMGHFLPGHGGVLDRVDSILMTVPFVYVLVVLFGAGTFQ